MSFCLFYKSKLNATQNSFKKYKKFMNSKLPNQPEPAKTSPNLKLICFIKKRPVQDFGLFHVLLLTYHFICQFYSRMMVLKSVHFKKTVARISIPSKLWYFLFWFVLKVPQFWKNQDSRNCLLKMNELYNNLFKQWKVRTNFGNRMIF